MSMSSHKFSRRSSAIDTRILIGIIADVETTIGFLLAGIGEVSAPTVTGRNFMMVTAETPLSDVEYFFSTLYNKKNIGVILIGADIKKSLATFIAKMKKTIPILLEIPTKSSLIRSLGMKEQTRKEKNANITH